MGSKLREYALLLVIVGFCAYLPSLFGSFVWDDEDFVYANQYVQQFRIDKFFTENAIAGRGKTSNYYRPLQFSLYSALYRLAGPSPWAFHLAGILLHLTAGVLVFLTIAHFLDPLPSFVASLFFLLHPVQTESVSYISGLSDQLYTSFFFGSLLAFLRRKGVGWSKEVYISLCLFILSFLSKELGIILPGILLFIILIQRKIGKKDIPVILAFFAVAALYLILRFTVLKFTDVSLMWKGSLYGASFFVRLGTFFHNFFVFLSLLVFPVSLFMERDFSIGVVTNVFSVWTFAFLLLNATVIGILIALRKKNTFRQALLFYILFVASLVPFSGIFLLNGIFYEHYLYLPMAFFWAAIIAALGPSLVKNRMVIWVFVFVISIFLVRSFTRQWEWIDNERFYRQTLERAPKSIRIINGLAMTLADQGNCNEALVYYKKALSLDPQVPNIYHNMANCFVSLGNVNEAEKGYLKALEVNPAFSFSYISLLDLYLKTGETAKAKRFLKERVLPRYPDSTEMKELYERLP